MSLKLLPSILTVGNLVFGTMSIVFVLSAEHSIAGVMIIIAAILDVMDGRVARKFDASSNFGKELDSLADVVSFGVAPAILIYSQVLSGYQWLGLGAIIWYVVAGALRLARFNLQTTTGFYQGVPITVGGSLIALLSFISDMISPMFFLILTAVLGFLMISKIRVPKL
ncbi:MAG: CDP-diacylglycerol--serine O-phosphatidyltransferase [Bacillota bacterium]|jgi:CDP-diacylglycerol--serine O-phosphatidyltransferase